MAEQKYEGRLHGTVKVSDREQVVIPAYARKEQGIKPGDLLFVMTGRNGRVLTITKADAVREIAEKIIQGFESTQPETHEE